MPIASAFRSALRWFGFVLLACSSPLVWAQGSTAADGFDPNVNGIVYATAVQPDGKVLIAGKFEWIQPNGATGTTFRNSIARLYPNGTNDATFTSEVAGQISAMVLQPDGRIIIGGKFTTVQSKTRNHIARLNADGTLDESFDPNIGGGLTPEVTSLALQADGKILVGGGFTTVQPNGASTATTRNRIARFNANGTVDTAFDPNANNTVLALAVQADGQILVGGGFTTLQPNGATSATARNRIARLKANGSVDDTFDPNANDSVSAIELLPDGGSLIGGRFITLAPNGGTAIASGSIRIARLNSAGVPVASTIFTGNIDGPVSVIKLQSDGNILVGGAFGTVGGSSRSYLARMYPSGSADLTFAPAPNFNVYALAVQSNGSIVLGGGFTTLRGTGVTSVIRNHVARVSPAGALDADFRPDVNGRLRSLIVQSNGKILVGGSFSSVAGQTHTGVVRLTDTGTLDTSFNVTLNGAVVAAVQQGTQIVIVGSFTRVNGAIRNYIARLNDDGSLDTSYDPSANGQINALLLQSDGKLLVGGSFTALRPNGATDATARNYLARLTTAGAIDDTYTAQTSDAVWSLVAQSDGKVLVGGAFTAVQPTGTTTTTTTRRAMARLNADGTLDTVFDPNVNGTVYAIAVQSDGKVVFGGNFLQMRPNSTTTTSDRSRLARVAADGSLDTTFSPGFNNVVTAIAIQSDQQILVGGGFTSVTPTGSTTGTTRRFIARVTSTGAVDAFDLNLDESPGNQVAALAVTGTKVVVGGAFSLLGPDSARVARSRIARVDSTGAVDTTFDPDATVGAGQPIAALALQYDGQIFAAGAFASLNGTGSANLARFYPDSVPDAAFVPNITGSPGSVNAVAEGPIKGVPVSTQRGGFAWVESNGQIRSTFVLGTEVTTLSSVTAIAVQSDQKVLIAGTMAITVSGTSTSANLARFNPDGTVDTSFALYTSGTINVIKVLSDGKILIGGTFTTINSLTRNNIARLATDGTVDTAFTVSADAAVYAIAFQSDGKMVLGGNFSSVAGNGSTTYTTRNYLARINADLSIDTDFNPKANSPVSSVAIQSDGKIVVGGSFTTFQPNGASATTTRNYIARLNTSGTLDETIDLKANGTVVNLTTQSDNKIIVAGYFTSLGGSTRNYLARLKTDLSLDDFNPNPNAPVTAVSLQADGKILVGGQFSALQPNTTTYDAALATPRNRAARLNADGTVDASFNPNFDSTVNLLVSYGDSSVIASGSFTTIQPTGALLVGGSFSAINGVAVSNLALLGGDGSVSSIFLPNPNGAVYALVQMADGRSVVGGSFTTVQSGGAAVTRNRIARFTDTNTLDTSFNPNADGDVFAIALQADGKLIVGGSFTNIGGVARSNLARLNTDGSADSSFNPAVSGAVHTVVVQTDGRILITRVTGTGTNSLVRLNADGSNDNTFAPANDAAVNSVAVQTDGKITVGGSFTTIAGTARKYLARLNADGSIDTSVTSSPNGVVTALTLQRDGKIVIGGTFSKVDGLPRYGIARVTASSISTESFTTNGGRNILTWSRSGAAPEVSGVQFESSPDGYTWTTLGAGARISGTSNWQISNISLSSADVYVRASAITPGSPNSSSGLIEGRGYIFATSISATPAITGAMVVNGASGSSFLYAIQATGVPTSFGASGLPAGLTINTTTGIISGTPTQMGTFLVQLTASNSAGSTSATLTLIIGAPGSISDEGRVINLSVLAPVSSGNPIIAGFVIKGSSPQPILLRAVGPGLTSLGVTSVLAAPNLKLYSGSTLKNEVNSWGGSSDLSTTFARLGAQPLAATSADAAVVVTLAPGPYTIWVSDLGTTGGTALAEVYDATQTPFPANSPRLVNIAARGVVSTTQSVTGGFVITGSTAKQILIRGIGPGLTGQGVSSVLADPIVTLTKINLGEIARNDNWETPVADVSSYPPATAAQIAAAATATGAFTLTSGSADAAILVTLAPGIYTAQVSGSGGTTGAAMVEVYEVP